MTPFTPVINPEIFELRPDYCATSVVADGVNMVPMHPPLSHVAEQVTAPIDQPAWCEDHLESWRAAYRAFGAKPQRTPCSVEALRTRLLKDGRLPSINPVVDLYNDVSVRFALPIGGENIDAYVGAPRLRRTHGGEKFDTTRNGVAVSEDVPVGEVVWADQRGATCRRWNWRQGLRTRIDFATRRMRFVLERLEPMPLDATREAAEMLMQGLREITAGVQLSAQVIDRHGLSKLSVTR